MYTLIAFFVTLGILITFHELGHYLTARACGVDVQRFSVGFGKVLFKRVDKHGTEWAVSAIPLGGYVKMLELPELGGPAGQEQRAFKLKPVWSRAAIVAAGPIFNLLLAVVLYAAINLVGVEEPVAILAGPAAGSPAALAGFEAQDKIIAVDDVPVASWSQVRFQLLRKLTNGSSPELTVVRAGQTLNKSLPITQTADFSGADPMLQTGLRLWGGEPKIIKVIAGGAGEAAGLLAGDIVLSADSLLSPDASALIQLIQRKAADPIRIRINRGGEALLVEVTPRAYTLESGASIGRIEVQLGGAPALTDVRYGLFESLSNAMGRTLDTSVFSLQMMGKMLLGEVSWRNVSGPVTIADYAGQTAKLGLSAYIAFLALVSISLGVLNLLPIPMLDGGHLLYYLIEVIKGSPVDEKWMELGQKAGVGVLACLMALAMFNDLVRLFS